MNGMMRMKNFNKTMPLGAIIILTFFALDAEAAHGGPVQPYHSEKMREQCHGVSKEMYEFGYQLTESNRKIFCAKFNDDQRKKAMQLASEKNIFGRPKMTPDKAVEKTLKETNAQAIQQKS